MGEFQTFVVKPDGSERAEGSAHDDDVLASAIGKFCLPGGTIYWEKGKTQISRSGYGRTAGATS